MRKTVVLHAMTRGTYPAAVVRFWCVKRACRDTLAPVLPTKGNTIWSV
ncbi:MAG: hypothetical protein ACI9HI_000954 [Salinirussus sp.]|jgi:hypothetical protein